MILWQRSLSMFILKMGHIMSVRFSDTSLTHFKFEILINVFYLCEKEIHKKVLALNFRDCHTKIRHVDAHATLNEGVVVQVMGELSNDMQPMRKFMQTFVLAPEVGPSNCIDEHLSLKHFHYCVSVVQFSYRVNFVLKFSDVGVSGHCSKQVLRSQRCIPLPRRSVWGF